MERPTGAAVYAAQVLEQLNAAGDVRLVGREQVPQADVVLNNSAAFGGYNAVACFAKPGVLPHPSTIKRAAA